MPSLSTIITKSLSLIVTGLSNFTFIGVVTPFDIVTWSFNIVSPKVTPILVPFDVDFWYTYNPWISPYSSSISLSKVIVVAWALLFTVAISLFGYTTVPYSTSSIVGFTESYFILIWHVPTFPA